MSVGCPVVMVYIGAALCVAVVVFFCMRRLRFFRRRRELLAAPLPQAWDEILVRNFGLYGKLPMDVKRRLGGYVNAFMEEKGFEACGDLEELTEEMMVTVAGQACLLLLSGKFGIFDRLSTVLLYPSVFSAASGVDEEGLDRGVEHRLGESWDTGSVVLSWYHVLHGPEVEQDGHNVVLHEFAHQLDQLDGVADGAPVLGSMADYRDWAKVFGSAYERHRSRIEKGRRLVIDDYGGTNPAEFFAVATESFFERPRKLKERYPELYDKLREFYALDPVEW